MDLIPNLVSAYEQNFNLILKKLIIKAVKKNWDILLEPLILICFIRNMKITDYVDSVMLTLLKTELKGKALVEDVTSWEPTWSHGRAKGKKQLLSTTEEEYVSATMCIDILERIRTCNALLNNISINAYV